MPLAGAMEGVTYTAGINCHEFSDNAVAVWKKKSSGGGSTTIASYTLSYDSKVVLGRNSAEVR